MFLRSSFLALAALLIAISIATAKPPGLPIDPHSDGKEPTPIAREFYEPVDPIILPTATGNSVVSSRTQDTYLEVVDMLVSVTIQLLGGLVTK